MTSPMYLPIPDRQAARLARLMVRVRKIVERVTPLVYGKLTVRQFRRDLPSGRLDEFLSSRDRRLIRLLQAHEGEIVLGFYAAMMQSASRFKQTGCVDDLVQDASEAVVLAMYGYDGSTEVCTYLISVIQNSILDNVKSRRYRMNRQLEHDQYIAEPHYELPEMGFGLDEKELMKEAMETTPLEPLERVLIDLFVQGMAGFQSKVARMIVNPKTNLPYTRMGISVSHKRAVKKIEGRYKELKMMQLRKAG